MSDTDDLVAEAWKHYAEACAEHDCELAKRACDELRRLIPEQRSGE